MNRPPSRERFLLQAIFVLAIVGLLVLVGVRLFHSRARSAPLSTTATSSSPQSTVTPTLGVKAIKHVAYGASPDQYMDVFMPSHSSRPTPVVMFVHGGDFIRSGTSSLYPEAQAVAKAGWVGVSVNYRIDGYPHESEDVLAAAAWIRAHAARYHVNPNRIALFGTSAGGNLVAEAATVAHQQHRNDGLSAVVSWSGPMDFVSFAHSIRNNPRLIGVGATYIGCPLTTCPSAWAAASPINHVSPGDPPMYLANSTAEVVPYSQATTMVKKLRSEGNTAQLFTVDGGLHALQYASQAFQPSINWLTHYLGPMRGALPSVPSGPGL